MGNDSESRSLEAQLDRERTYSRELREYTDALIARFQSNQKRAHELEQAIGQVQGALQSERLKAVCYLAELQGWRRRVGSFEARGKNQAHELEVLRSQVKNHASEIARAQGAVREELETGHARELERLRVVAEGERASYLRERTELESKRREELLSARAEGEASGRAERGTAEGTFKAEIERLSGSTQALEGELNGLRLELSQAREEASRGERLSRQEKADLIRVREEAAQALKQLEEERRERMTLEQSRDKSEITRHQALQTSREQTQRVARELAESDRAVDAYQNECAALRELVITDQRRVRQLAERLLAAWGDEDPALKEIFEALRDAAETQTVETSVHSNAKAKAEAQAKAHAVAGTDRRVRIESSSPSMEAKLDIVTGGPKAVC